MPLSINKHFETTNIIFYILYVHIFRSIHIINNMFTLVVKLFPQCMSDIWCIKHNSRIHKLWSSYGYMHFFCHIYVLLIIYILHYVSPVQINFNQITNFKYLPSTSLHVAKITQWPVWCKRNMNWYDTVKFLTEY